MKFVDIVNIALLILQISLSIIKQLPGHQYEAIVYPAMNVVLQCESDLTGVWRVEMV